MIPQTAETKHGELERVFDYILFGKFSFIHLQDAFKRAMKVGINQYKYPEALLIALDI